MQNIKKFPPFCRLNQKKEDKDNKEKTSLNIDICMAYSTNNIETWENMYIQNSFATFY